MFSYRVLFINAAKELSVTPRCVHKVSLGRDREGDSTWVSSCHCSVCLEPPCALCRNWDGEGSQDYGVFLPHWIFSAPQALATRKSFLVCWWAPAASCSEDKGLWAAASPCWLCPGILGDKLWESPCLPSVLASSPPGYTEWLTHFFFPILTSYKDLTTHPLLRCPLSSF